MIEGSDRELFGQSLAAAVDAGSAADVDRALAEVGWRDALDVDEAAAVALLFDAQGRANATSSALDVVLARALGVDDPVGVAVVLPPVGGTAPPGAVEGDELRVQGLATAAVDRASAVVVVAAAPTPTRCTVEPGDLDRRPVHGLDPSLGLVELGGVVRPVTTEPLDSPGGWTDGVAAGQRAVAHELVGTARTMLALARDHALERIQFGQPIAMFQAVRHKLADAHVAIEAAEAVADAAWSEGTPFAASVAKAVAGRSGRLVAKHAQQVLAGIGFTAEHDLHHHVRRVLVLDALLGDSRRLTAAMGAELLAARALPRTLPL